MRPKQISVFILTTAMLLCAAVPASAAAPVYRNKMPQNPTSLNAKVDLLAKKYGVVGMSVAAFEHDHVVYTHSYGLRDIDAGLPATDETKYRVASISKMVTASLAMMLGEETDFSIDDDLRKIMPDMVNPYYPEEPITARNLIMHTAGLADAPAYTEAVGEMKFPPIKTILTDRGMWIAAKAGTRYNYTNFGAGAVSGVIERHSGMRFYEYARTRLFEPLGIDAAYSVQLVKDQSLIASMYDQNLQLTAAPSRWGNMNTVYDAIPLGEMYLLGHGDLFISARDLAKIGIIYAGDGTYKNKRYLTEEALKQMNTLVLRDKYTGVARGLGTFAMTNITKGRMFFGHQGNAYGTISGMFYDPITETGVVLLTNGSNSAKGEQGLYHVNREIMGEVWKYLLPS